MSDVLLTHSYFMHFDPKQARAMMPYPPLAALYAAAVLEADGISVTLFDTMLAHSEQELRTALKTHHPRILAIYDDDFNYLTKMCLTRMREAAFVMTRIAKEFDARVVVHGSDASDHAAEYLAHGADAVLIGESESTLDELCRRLLGCTSTAMSEICGLAYLDDGVLHRTPKREITTQLDTLPFPAWHLVDRARYRELWIRHHGYYSLNMVTTRGCPYHCNWCAKPIYGQVYHARSPEHVVEEIRILQQTMQPDHIWFADDIFGLKPGWVQKFSALMRQHDLHIRFKIQSRADLLTHENTVEALAIAGCEEVWIGAESGSQKILDAMEKGTTVGQIAAARRLLREHGVRAAFFLQFGYLGETSDDIGRTIRMVKDLQPDDIGISVSYPLPGTKFFEIVKADLKLKQNWVDSDDLAMMYRSTYPSAYYKRLHRYVHKIFRSGQAFRMLEDMVRLRAVPTVTHIKRIASLSWYLPGMLIDRMRLSDLEKRSMPTQTGTTRAVRSHEAARNARMREVQEGDAAAAFSAQAPMFDEIERHNPILQWMRAFVHDCIDVNLQPCDSMLDLSAGTGIDAIRFARLGHPVHAIDLADGMIAELQKKIDTLDLGHLVCAQRLSFLDLAQLPPKRFTHAISNMGGLNCVPDLRQVAEGLKQLLEPGGTVTLVMMPRWCPWEMMQMLRGNFALAFRRFHRNGTRAHIEGHYFRTWYHSVGKAIDDFGPDFTVLGVQGLASLSPPPFMDRFPKNFPRTYRALTRLDETLGGHWPFNRCADHYILTLRYRPRTLTASSSARP